MKILVTGANGQVGHELILALASDPRHQAIPLARTDLDISEPAATRAAMSRHAPDIVVNAAAYTAVDRAEQEPDRADAVNRRGPANLAAACLEHGVPLIHLSTDYVFDGKKEGEYREDDATAPLGVYGLTKLQGEEEIRATTARHLILRTSWVFGAHGANFVKTMLRLGRERRELRIVADQHGCPTPAADIAAVIMQLIDRIGDREGSVDWGSYHYCGEPATTWFDFAGAIFRQAESLSGLPAPRLIPIPTAEYPTPAKRPSNSVLSCEKLARSFGIAQPKWEDGLAAVLRELLTPNC